MSSSSRFPTWVRSHAGSTSRVSEFRECLVHVRAVRKLLDATCSEFGILCRRPSGTQCAEDSVKATIHFRGRLEGGRLSTETVLQVTVLGNVQILVSVIWITICIIALYVPYRTWPLYAILTLLMAYLYVRLGDGPMWSNNNLPTRCNATWLANLLLVNNVLGFSQTVRGLFSR